MPAGEMLKRYLLDQRISNSRRDARRSRPSRRRRTSPGARKPCECSFSARSATCPIELPSIPEVVGTLTRKGYRVEKVIFESRPNHHVTANLYLPEGKPPFPGVLLPCGHSDNGKAYEGYQRACILLARNGMAGALLRPDRPRRAVSASGRSGQARRARHDRAHNGGDRCAPGRPPACQLPDLGRLPALDYLASRPEVDPDRLGCTGNSGGGTLTAYLMALDDRIKVAAPSCFITSLERLFATIGPQDAEQNITGDVAAGMEHADYMTIRAPKPTLLRSAPATSSTSRGAGIRFGK